MAESLFSNEVAWLIELSIDGVAHWWFGSGFIANAEQAVRFCRSADANTVIMEQGLVGAEAVEHMWQTVPASNAAETAVTPERKVGAVERLHSICDALSEQADESPFTREEWERIDKQTVVHLALLRRCYDELPNPEFISDPEKEQRVKDLLQDLARVVCKPLPVKTTLPPEPPGYPAKKQSDPRT